MNFKTKGIVTHISSVVTTAIGTAVQHIHLKQEDKKEFFPTAMGSNISLLRDLKEGDEIEIDFHIKGSKKNFNNVYIDNLVRL